MDNTRLNNVAISKTRNEILDIKNLSVKYKNSDNSNQLTAVKNVSFKIDAGQKFCLVGESGSGKTTIALAVTKLLPENTLITGDICFDGISILNLSETELLRIRKESISFIFQDTVGSLVPNMTIGKQYKRVLSHRLNTSDKSVIENIINKSLTKVGLNDINRILTLYPHQLSGGMCQRVIIAMALCVKPSLVIADEPTASLDVVTQKIILDLLIELQSEFNYALFYITHDLRIAYHYSDIVGVMKNGELIELNSKESFFNKQENNYSKDLINSARMLSI